VCCDVEQCVAVCCGVLLGAGSRLALLSTRLRQQCNVGSVLQCGTVRCSVLRVLIGVGAVQCVACAVCCVCSVLRVLIGGGSRSAPQCVMCVAVCCSVLQCVAVCCSVLQCVAVCCSVLCVLQCVAVCCTDF